MIDQNNATEILTAIDKRRDERRRFIKVAGSGAAAIGSMSLLSACGSNNDPAPTPTPTPVPSPTPTPTPTATANLDLDILNFALNLEYLEAQYYLYAVTGAGLPTNQTASGSGTAGGTVTGGAQVDFSGDPLIAAYAREIAADEAAHVAFLRQAIGTSAVAMPNINISPAVFSALATAAQIDQTAGAFNPYSSPNNFLLGAFIFEDVGVTAYKGAAPLITNKTYLEAAAGILAAEAYHAGLIRTILYNRGIGSPTTAAIPALITNANKISDARDSVDGTQVSAAGTPATATVAAADDDQGITNTDGTANLVPTDANAIAYSRSVSQVLNIVYLNTSARTAGASMGAFFPNGVNANMAAFRTSIANP